MRECAARVTTAVTGPTRAAVYRLARSGPFGKKRCKSAAELRKPADRQPDDVQVVALDPLDEHATAPLDRVAAGAAAPLAGPQIPVHGGLVERVKRDPRDLDRGLRLAVAHEREAADHVVRPAAERPQRGRGCRIVGRLAPDDAV